MKKHKILFAVLILATLFSIQPTVALAQGCPVNEIYIDASSDGTLPGVTRVWIGNMVSPDPSCTFYCCVEAPSQCLNNRSCTNTTSQWVWKYDGSNCNKFSLELNYEQVRLGPSTAVGTVTIDPTKMAPGSSPNVHVILSNCSRGTGNCLLRVNGKASTQGNGISYGNTCQGTESCTFDPQCRLQ